MDPRAPRCRLSSSDRPGVQEGQSTGRPPGLPPWFLGLAAGLCFVALFPIYGALHDSLQLEPLPEHGPSDFIAAERPDPPNFAEQPAASLVFMAGRAKAGQESMGGLEAVLRLHSYLGLRDIFRGQLRLDWSPVSDAVSASQHLDQACDFTKTAGTLLATGAHPDPLGRETRASDDNRLVLLLERRPGGAQLEAVLCDRTGARRPQVFELRDGSEGETLREVVSWAAAQTGAPEAGDFMRTWGQAPISGRAGLSRYGDVLRATMEGESHVLSMLDEAAEEVAEAAWLLAQLGPKSDALAHLRRARLGRPEFSAALEDSAVLLGRSGQLETMLRELSLLPLTGEEQATRDVRALVAGRLLEEGHAGAARAILEELPGKSRALAHNARLLTLTSLKLERDQEVQQQVEIWLQAQPNEPEALAAAGRVRAAAGRWDEAQDAWEVVVDKAPDLRGETVSRWAQEALLRQDTARLLRVLEERDPGLRPDTREVFAYLLARNEDWAHALSQYDRLSELPAPTPSSLQTRCLVALISGQEDRASGRCVGLSPTALEGALARTAFDSRRPGLIPGYRIDSTRPAKYALRVAPRDPAVAITALLSLGPDLDEGDREHLAARWRVAVGAGVEIPDDASHRPGPMD